VILDLGIYSVLLQLILACNLKDFVKIFSLNRLIYVQKYYTFLLVPVNYELRLAVFNFLRIFSLNCS